MGYFPNGTSGMDYEERYCDHCVHRGQDDGPGCALWLAHLLYNYQECNNEKSILHVLIPMKDGVNQQCRMFVEGAPAPTKTLTADEQRRQQYEAEYLAKRGK